MTKSPPKKHMLGGIGLLIGILALAAAFLSPWIAEQIDPPARAMEEGAVDFAARLADVAKAKIKGEKYIPTAITELRPSRYLAPSVIAAGMVAALLGVVGGLRSEDRIISGGAVGIGIGAALVQFSLIIAGALLFFVLVGVVIAAFETAGA
jgi:hypothetical protein